LKEETVRWERHSAAVNAALANDGV
jgi:hypothetical protein